MNKLVYRSYKESDNMKIINEFEINNDFGCNNYVARSNSWVQVINATFKEKD